MSKLVLADTHPDLVEEFHPSKNMVKVEKVSYGSKTKVWWLGKECGHEWLMSPLSRSSGQGCAVCSGKQVQPGVNDLRTVYPELVKYWHPNKNKTVEPDTTVSVLKKNYWLLECGHEKYVSAKTFSSHPKCLICANQKLVKGVNDLVTVHPSVARLWHPTKNSSTPDNILPSSKTKTWWLGGCGHEWEASPKTVLASKTVCPYCGRRELLTGFNDLATTNPEILLVWNSKKNKNTPNTVLSGSHTKIWFQGACGHEWEKEARRAFPVKCPFCSKSGRLLAGFNDLGTLSPELAKQWHPNVNTKTVHTIRNKSSYKAWWVCDQGHEWEATVNDRQRGFGCPVCATSFYSSKAETEIYDFIVKDLGFAAEQNTRTIIRGELDVYVPAKKVAVEYNGLYWHSEKQGKNKNYHYDKWKACKEQGIQLIQI